MFGLDESIAALSDGDLLLVVIGVAVLLGLRHATDPDHLTTVSTMFAGNPGRSSRGAARLGTAWGLGHATTLVAFGLPIVLAGAYLPQWVTRAAEMLVGVIISVLALRVLMRWRSGRLQGGSVDRPGSARLGAGAFAVGLLHGVGGSAGVGILLLAGIPDQGFAIVALLVFALASAAAMATASGAFGWALSHEPAGPGVISATPLLGVFSLAFGLWYLLAGMHAVPYVF